MIIHIISSILIIIIIMMIITTIQLLLLLLLLLPLLLLIIIMMIIIIIIIIIIIHIIIAKGTSCQGHAAGHPNTFGAAKVGVLVGRQGVGHRCAVSTKERTLRFHKDLCFSTMPCHPVPLFACLRYLHLEFACVFEGCRRGAHAEVYLHKLSWDETTGVRHEQVVQGGQHSRSSVRDTHPCLYTSSATLVCADSGGLQSGILGY